MKGNVILLARDVVLVAAVMLLIMATGMILDLRLAHYPFDKLLVLSTTEARHLSNALNRNFNQLLAVSFTTVAIAVPLTGNMYSLKFLEFFIKDRVNAAVLTFVVFADLNNTWVSYGIKEDFVPIVQLHLSLALAIVGFALLFPYLYYVFRFLHPHTLLTRLEQEITDHLISAVKRPSHAGRYRSSVSEGIEHIANITVRSIDRLDRSTAIESIFSLERVAQAYWAIKEDLTPAWFMADANFFLGFSQAAVDELTESRTWVEMKFFHQIRQIVSAAIPKTHDVTSTTARTLRRLGVEEAARRDLTVCEMVMEYFNTFVRLSIQRKDPRSVFIIFDQYRNYAIALNVEWPDLVLEIAFYFGYYGQVARDSQLPFVVEAVAHDLGSIVRHAWETNAPNRQKLLNRFLHYDSQAKAPLPGVKRAHALLASYFLLAGYSEPADLIRKSFAGLDATLLRNLADDLLSVKREKYWEVNERRMNMDYVPEAQRKKLQEFLDSLQSTQSA